MLTRLKELFTGHFRTTNTANDPSVRNTDDLEVIDTSGHSASGSPKISRQGATRILQRLKTPEPAQAVAEGEPPHEEIQMGEQGENDDNDEDVNDGEQKVAAAANNAVVAAQNNNVPPGAQTTPTFITLHVSGSVRMMHPDADIILPNSLRCMTTFKKIIGAASLITAQLAGTYYSQAKDGCDAGLIDLANSVANRHPQGMPDRLRLVPYLAVGVNCLGVIADTCDWPIYGPVTWFRYGVYLYSKGDQKDRKKSGVCITVGVVEGVITTLVPWFAISDYANASFDDGYNACYRDPAKASVYDAVSDVVDEGATSVLYALGLFNISTSVIAGLHGRAKGLQARAEAAREASQAIQLPNSLLSAALR